MRQDTRKHISEQKNVIGEVNAADLNSTSPAHKHPRFNTSNIPQRQATIMRNSIVSAAIKRL